MFDIEDYDYDLPEELIAQVPASDRDASRLLVLERSGKSLSDRHFFDLPGLLRSGDVLGGAVGLGTLRRGASSIQYPVVPRQSVQTAQEGNPIVL
jgi:hypothetical protein